MVQIRTTDYLQPLMGRYLRIGGADLLGRKTALPLKVPRKCLTADRLWPVEDHNADRPFEVERKE